MTVNKGIFKPDKYIKHVSFSRAVLWKNRELSLPPSIMKKIEKEKIPLIRFIDDGKQEQWDFDTEDVVRLMMLKQVGQEKQYYFPIGLAKRYKPDETRTKLIRI